MSTFPAPSVVLLLVICAAPLPSLANDDRDRISGYLDYYAAKTAFRFEGLAPDELEALLDGEPVIDVTSAADTAHDGEISAVGIRALQILPAPRLLVWLSVMGGNDERDYRLTRATLSRGDNGSYVRYQHVALPWPVRDRHWVIQCHKNLALAADSDGAVWEHLWSLHEQGPQLLASAHANGDIEGLDAEDLQKSIYLPTNTGAWTLVDIGDYRTLVIAYLDADLGGRFPDVLVRAFAKRRLKSGLESLRELSSRVHRSYTGQPAIHDGSGRPILRRLALDVAERWRNEAPPDHDSPISDRLARNNGNDQQQ